MQSNVILGMEIDPLVYQFAMKEDDPCTTMAKLDPQCSGKEACLFHKHEH